MSTTSHQGKCWIGFDWDGTLFTYSNWETQGYAMGSPILPSWDRVRWYLAEGTYDVKIFTARCCDANTRRDDDLANIRRLCVEQIGRELEITNVKDFACAAIYDDIAITVLKNEGPSNIAEMKVGIGHPSLRPNLYPGDWRAQ